MFLGVLAFLLTSPSWGLDVRRQTQSRASTEDGPIAELAPLFLDAKMTSEQVRSLRRAWSAELCLSGPCRVLQMKRVQAEIGKLVPRVNAGGRMARIVGDLLRRRQCRADAMCVAGGPWRVSLL